MFLHSILVCFVFTILNLLLNALGINTGPHNYELHSACTNAQTVIELLELRVKVTFLTCYGQRLHQLYPSLGIPGPGWSLRAAVLAPD